MQNNTLWQEEIRHTISKIGLIYDLSNKDLVPFLTATLCGQLVLAGYSSEFVKNTLDHMFESYLKIKERKVNI